MITIIIWALIALGIGLYDGYAYQNEPNFILSILTIAFLGVIEQFRWGVANKVTIQVARKDLRWDRHFKVFGLTSWLALIAGGFAGLSLSN